MDTQWKIERATRDDEAAMTERQHDAGEYWASVLTAANYAQFYQIVGAVVVDCVRGRIELDEFLLRIMQAHGNTSKANRGLWNRADRS
ncbi:MAG TPA: hypothetical protein P5572_04110 [Phycisphaerae bacterium]|nr:hypothetical protein [Pseudomonadales bacterium]HRX84183.1 hypothetical protein [Phycisphaerae bacterium]